MGDTLTMRKELHALLDRLPDQTVEAARTRLLSLVDPVEELLFNAEPDDEPLSAHEVAALRQADLRRERGELPISHEEILREFQKE